MAKRPRDYFTFIDRVKSGSAHDRAALNSLDIIDTKASGLAGLIGGFSAAATFALQVGEPWKNGPGIDLALLSVSLVALATAGICCAMCLNILSHFNDDLMAPDNSDGTRDSKLEQVYKSRVGSYRIAHRAFVIGAGTLMLGTLAILAERGSDSVYPASAGPSLQDQAPRGPDGG